ncbi:hypothetical protein CAC42_3769 [Sphaceloma murrayae]|uniref:Uncharacterized protein n=1 Tax=Sphaceloma murrayae TaxID=2082308 RepID=A0A2K1QHZ8_9PEZI|nr:hypothetical protein CAC42_3769 [Sphaceloma murrayae]
MGTRSLTLVYHNGKYVIAQYGQWDGYPEGNGVKILTFLLDPTNLPKLLANLDNLYVPDEAELEEYNRQAEQVSSAAHEARYDREAYAQLNFDEQRIVQDRMSNPLKIVCPSLSRDTGAGILQLVAETKARVPIQLEPDFIEDTLFCEWAYVVNVDEGELEAYAGNHVGMEGRHSFADRKSRPALMGLWRLDDLPSEKQFLADIKEVLEFDQEEGDIVEEHSDEENGIKREGIEGDQSGSEDEDEEAIVV